MPLELDIRRQIWAVLDGSGHAAGVAFTIKDNLLATCAHVVNLALGRDESATTLPIEPLYLRSPSEPSELQAKVVEWFPLADYNHCNPAIANDIAILRTNLQIPGAIPLRISPLHSDRLLSETWASVYFPEDFNDGKPLTGRTTGANSNGDLLLGIADIEIERGASGAPLISAKHKMVIGILTSFDSDNSDRFEAAPAQQILFAVPSLARPFRALNQFNNSDAHLFFGRDHESQELANRISNNITTLLLGPSGSGKSSIVQAGVVPLLERKGWTSLPIRPRIPIHQSVTLTTSRNHDSRNTAPPSADTTLIALKEHCRECAKSHLLLIIDPLEEIQDCPSNWAFLDDMVNYLNSMATSSEISILLVCRSDYLNTLMLSGYQNLIKALNKSDFKLVQPTPEELIKTIKEPASLFGVKMADDLAAAIQADSYAGNTPFLPGLQFVLDQLWQLLEGRTIGLEEYKRIGRIRGALARYASKVEHGLTPAELETTKRILLKLVRIKEAENGELDRRICRRQADFTLDEFPVVRKLAAHRLLRLDSTSGQEHSTVELAHDSLLDSWPLLQRLIGSNRDFLAWKADIQATIAAGAFLAIGKLRESMKWIASPLASSLSGEETKFVKHSILLGKFALFVGTLIIFSFVALLIFAHTKNANEKIAARRVAAKELLSATTGPNSTKALWRLREQPPEVRHQLIAELITEKLLANSWNRHDWRKILRVSVGSDLAPSELKDNLVTDDCHQQADCRAAAILLSTDLGANDDVCFEIVRLFHSSWSDFHLIAPLYSEWTGLLARDIITPNIEETIKIKDFLQTVDPKPALHLAVPLARQAKPGSETQRIWNAFFASSLLNRELTLDATCDYFDALAEDWSDFEGSLRDAISSKALPALKDREKMITSCPGAIPAILTEPVGQQSLARHKLSLLGEAKRSGELLAKSSQFRDLPDLSLELEQKAIMILVDRTVNETRPRVLIELANEIASYPSVLRESNSEQFELPLRRALVLGATKTDLLNISKARQMTTKLNPETIAIFYSRVSQIARGIDGWPDRDLIELLAKAPPYAKPYVKDVIDSFLGEVEDAPSIYMFYKFAEAAAMLANDMDARQVNRLYTQLMETSREFSSSNQLFSFISVGSRLLNKLSAGQRLALIFKIEEILKKQSNQKQDACSEGALLEIIRPLFKAAYIDDRQDIQEALGTVIPLALTGDTPESLLSKVRPLAETLEQEELAQVRMCLFKGLQSADNQNLAKAVAIVLSSPALFKPSEEEIYRKMLLNLATSPIDDQALEFVLASAVRVMNLPSDSGYWQIIAALKNEN